MRSVAKPYLDYECQIEKLKSKHLIISDEEYALKMLKKYSYYSLICGYKEPFKIRLLDFTKIVYGNTKGGW